MSNSPYRIERVGISYWERQHKLDEAKRMYAVAVGNRDAEMIRHWAAELDKLNGQG